MPAECCISAQLGNYALDFLRVDKRPTFIVFVPSNFLAGEKAAVLFTNDALQDVEKRGELSTEWVLSEEFLKYGGGCFPGGRWRFTTVVVEDNVVTGKVMVVTATDMPTMEWNVASELKRPLTQAVTTDQRDHGEKDYQIQPTRINGNGCQITPSALSLILCRKQKVDRESDNNYAKMELESKPRPMAQSYTRKRPLVEMDDVGDSTSKFNLEQSLYSGPFMDWTQGYFPTQASQHYRNLRAVDWSKTKCGPYDTWPPCLKVMANTIMTMPYPTSFYWGSDYTIIYNEEWAKIAQNKDPKLLGKDFVDGWPEVKEFFLPLLNAAYYNGQGTTKEAQQLFLNRGNIIEESYFNFSICAVVGMDGVPVGIIEQAFEQTRQIVSSRRMATLQRMGRLLASVTDLDEDNFWKLLVDAFDDNPLDSPFLLIYRTVSEEQSNSECEGDLCYLLEGNVGFPEGSILAPKEGRVGEDYGYFSPEMKLAKETNNVVVKKLDFNSTQDWDKVVYRGFEDRPTLAAIIPIQATKTITQGFLILGLNPRRPYDGDYKMWLDLLKKELATTAGKARLLKAEIMKAINEESQRVAAIQAIELQSQLQKRTEELRHSELLFTRTAESITVALALLSLDGELLFENDAYYELTTLSRGITKDWRDIIYIEDRSRVFALFEKAIRSRSVIPMQWETRCGLDSSNPKGWKYWVSCSIVAQTDCQKDGTEKTTGYIMTLVDITSTKMNEEHQRQLSTQAVERRRQQENFIDIFSHELRNPFSATLQCADGILGTLMEFQCDGKEELNVEEMIDSASTILVCVQHQMRIIDDVLTLSKLDSMLLSVVPVDVQIHECVSQTMKIFQSELQVKGIISQYLIEDSYNELNVDWIKADPSRFSQILMNLVTNAIKFTSLQASKREIITRLGASLERPTGHGAVIYHDSDDPPSKDLTHADWGSGEIVYILVTIQDSGIGISEEWQKKLFKRFEQVPRTHITYGGSGLGLFICRQLCRIQGGEIGVYSEEGRGSSFSFYIKVRRSSCPSNPQTSPHQQPVRFPVKPSKYEELATVPSGVGGRLFAKSGRVPRLSQVDTSRRGQVSYSVLIVEDNLINQEVLRRQLRKEGCVTHVAGNGDEALKIITGSKFVNEGGISIDIVLMDMEMPVMDGNTATVKIREMERSGTIKKHVPIMGISANARPEQVAKMTEAGMDDAISKPFRIFDLLIRFDSLLANIEDLDSRSWS